LQDVAASDALLIREPFTLTLVWGAHGDPFLGDGVQSRFAVTGHKKGRT
jgi:hypothetical protein